jgi:2-methylfumaryl-CoA isomerase
MTGNLAPLVAAQDAARTIAGHLAFLAETQPASVPDVRISKGWHGGFARDFATADGERVMVAALTRQQFADLAKTTRLASTFAFLERVLYADFSTCGDLYTHRHTIATLLAPWFSRRTAADLAAAFAGTSVPWARIDNLTGRPGSRR